MKGQHLHLAEKKEKKVGSVGAAPKRTGAAAPAKRKGRSAKQYDRKSSHQKVLMPEKLEIANNFLSGVAIPV